MATSQTMSNVPTDWLSQSFHTDFFNTSQTETPPITAAAGGGSTTSADSRNNYHLSPDTGRVAKPLRRRSRASRRTPTTLFNTDTTNFRAMVQRFTGGPAASFAPETSAPPGGGRGLNFMEHIAAARQGSGFPMQYPNQGLQQQQQMMMFMMGGGEEGVPAAAPPRSPSVNESRSYENYML